MSEKQATKDLKQ